MSTGKIFVFEPHGSSLKRTAAVIEQAGYTALTASNPEEATALLEDEDYTALLIAHNSAGVELSQYVREFTEISAPLAAVIKNNEERHDECVSEMSADGFVRRPVNYATLESFLSFGKTIDGLRQELRSTKTTLTNTKAELNQLPTSPSTSTGFHHFDVIKDLLVVEVRRAKRYGYPLAVLLVGLDPLPPAHEKHKSTLQREITAGLAVAIAKSIRVIDLPIHYADDRILVFLPHTDLVGGEEVARRIKRRIKRITYRTPKFSVSLTASVGVAGITAGDSLTFSRLIKSATAALKAAQLKGGDKVMKRVPSRA